MSDPQASRFQPPDHVTELLRGGRTDEALTELRRLDFPFIRAVKVVHDLTGHSLSDSKVIVHESRAWAEKKGDREAFAEELREAFTEAVTELQRGDPPEAE
jgi:hypothetical protein